MKTAWKHFWRTLFLLAALGSTLPGQDSPSLADLARKTREQKQGASPARVLTEDTIPRRRRLKELYCLPVTRLPAIPQPCRHVEVDVNVRGEAVFGGGSNYFVHYNLKLKNGHDYRVAFWPEDKSTAEPRSALENARRNFLLNIIHKEGGSDFTSPAKELYAEDTLMEGRPALLVSFQGSSNLGLRRGVAVFIVAAPLQVIATSCTFLAEDVSESGPLCDDIVKSTQIVILPEKLDSWHADDGGEL